MKRILIAVCSILIGISVVLYVTCFRYIEYVPILRNNDPNHTFIVSPDICDENHQKAVMQILEKYDENYQIKNNKLLIRKSLANDLDLLSNYTKKAIALSKEKQRNWDRSK